MLSVNSLPKTHVVEFIVFSRIEIYSLLKHIIYVCTERTQYLRYCFRVKLPVHQDYCTAFNTGFDMQQQGRPSCH